MNCLGGAGQGIDDLIPPKLKLSGPGQAVGVYRGGLDTHKSGAAPGPPYQIGVIALGNQAGGIPVHHGVARNNHPVSQAHRPQ